MRTSTIRHGYSQDRDCHRRFRLLPQRPPLSPAPGDPLAPPFPVAHISFDDGAAHRAGAVPRATSWWFWGDNGNIDGRPVQRRRQCTQRGIHRRLRRLPGRRHQ